MAFDLKKEVQERKSHIDYRRKDEEMCFSRQDLELAIEILFDRAADDLVEFVRTTGFIYVGDSPVFLSPEELSGDKFDEGRLGAAEAAIKSAAEEFDVYELCCVSKKGRCGE